MNKSFKEFTEEFPEFCRVTPTYFIASFSLEKDPEKEILINLETGSIKSFHKIPLKYHLRLIKFSEKHMLSLDIKFEDINMEKTGNNKLAELYMAREKLTKKNLEKTASIEDKKDLDMIEKEIEKIEIEQ